MLLWAIIHEKIIAKLWMIRVWPTVFGTLTFSFTALYIFAYDFANVVMKPEPKVWNIFVHMYNKKVLKHGE